MTFRAHAQTDNLLAQARRPGPPPPHVEHRKKRSPGVDPLPPGTPTINAMWAQAELLIKRTEAHRAARRSEPVEQSPRKLTTRWREPGIPAVLQCSNDSTIKRPNYQVPALPKVECKDRLGLTQTYGSEQFPSASSQQPSQISNRQFIQAQKRESNEVSTVERLIQTTLNTRWYLSRFLIHRITWFLQAHGRDHGRAREEAANKGTWPSELIG